MKSLAFVFLLVWLESGGGGVLASPTTTGGEPNEDNRTCTMSADVNETSRHTQLVEVSLQCMWKDRDIDNLGRLRTIVEFRQVFSNYCRGKEAIKKCLDKNLSEAKLCVNRTHEMVVEALNVMLETGLKLGCVDEGEVFARIFYGLHSEDEPDHMAHCLDAINLRRKQTNAVPQKRVTNIYHHLEEIKECLLTTLPSEQQELKTLMVDYVDNVRRSFRCIHPEEHRLVLCSSLPNSK